MSDIPDWFPSIIRFEDHDGDWNRYVEAVHDIYLQDWQRNRPFCNGQRVGVKRHPQADHGRDATFWHLISEGHVELEREPDVRRMERIGWPHPTISNCERDEVRVWREPRGGEKRVHIWCADASYLVVLAERKNYLLLWTAYPVEEEHSRRKLEKRWKQFGDK